MSLETGSLAEKSTTPDVMIFLIDPWENKVVNFAEVYGFRLNMPDGPIWNFDICDRNQEVITIAGGYVDVIIDSELAEKIHSGWLHAGDDILIHYSNQSLFD